MSSSTAQYEALADQIESILQNPEAATQIKDERLRRRLAEGGRKLGISFEEPGDTLRRFGYMVWSSSYPMTSFSSTSHSNLSSALSTSPGLHRYRV